MKNLFKPLLFLFFAASLASCASTNDVIDEQIVDGKRPFVDFDIVPTADPFEFDLVNKAENYKTLEWRFGDDSLGNANTTKHLYATTGTYDVTLTAISESGATAKKLYVIKIDPDNILTITAPKVGTNTVKFNIESTATISSVLWTLDPETKLTEMSPSRQYTPGTLNEFTLKATTDKGSVIEVTKFATTEGVVSNVTNKVTTQVSKDNGGGPTANEGSLKIIDNNVETKLYLPGWGGSWWMQFLFPTPTTIKFYGIGSGNDSPDRDPKEWTLQGSNDGSTWTVLDTQVMTQNFYDQKGQQYKQMFYYAVANPGSYLYYRYNVTSNFGSGDFQISDFRLFK